MGSRRKLATFVHVNGTAYGPNDDVPADVAKLITNPKAWGQEPDDEGDEPVQVEPEPTPADQAEADAAEATEVAAQPAKKTAAKSAAKKTAASKSGS